MDLRTLATTFVLDTECPRVQQLSNSKSYCRRSVADKLSIAQSLLPLGIFLVIKEAYRPLKLQRQFFEDRYNSLRQANPTWTDERVYEVCCKLTAPPEVGPHTTGGAIDLTLGDAIGNELDMGTVLNASPEKCGDATYTDACNISLVGGVW